MSTNYLDDFDLDPLRGYVPSPSSRFHTSYFSVDPLAASSPATASAASTSAARTFRMHDAADENISSTYGNTDHFSPTTQHQHQQQGDNVQQAASTTTKKQPTTSSFFTKQNFSPSPMSQMHAEVQQQRELSSRGRSSVVGGTTTAARSSSSTAASTTRRFYDHHHHQSSSNMTTNSNTTMMSSAARSRNSPFGGDHPEDVEKGLFFSPSPSHHHHCDAHSQPPSSHHTAAAFEIPTPVVDKVEQIDLDDDSSSTDNTDDDESSSVASTCEFAAGGGDVSHHRDHHHHPTPDHDGAEREHQHHHHHHNHHEGEPSRKHTLVAATKMLNSLRPACHDVMLRVAGAFFNESNPMYYSAAEEDNEEDPLDPEERFADKNHGGSPADVEVLDRVMARLAARKENEVDEDSSKKRLMSSLRELVARDKDLCNQLDQDPSAAAFVQDERTLLRPKFDRDVAALRRKLSVLSKDQRLALNEASSSGATFEQSRRVCMKKLGALSDMLADVEQSVAHLTTDFEAARRCEARVGSLSRQLRSSAQQLRQVRHRAELYRSVSAALSSFEDPVEAHDADADAVAGHHAADAPGVVRVGRRTSRSEMIAYFQRPPSQSAMWCRALELLGVETAADVVVLRRVPKEWSRVLNDEPLLKALLSTIVIF